MKLSSRHFNLVGILLLILILSLGYSNCSPHKPNGLLSQQLHQGGGHSTRLPGVGGGDDTSSDHGNPGDPISKAYWLTELIGEVLQNCGHQFSNEDLHSLSLAVSNSTELPLLLGQNDYDVYQAVEKAMINQIIPYPTVGRVQDCAETVMSQDCAEILEIVGPNFKNYSQIHLMIPSPSSCQAVYSD